MQAEAMRRIWLLGNWHLLWQPILSSRGQNPMYGAITSGEMAFSPISCSTGTHPWFGAVQAGRGSYPNSPQELDSALQTL